MNESIVFFLYKLRILVAGLLIMASLLLLAFFLSTTEVDSILAQGASPSTSVVAIDASENPNVVAGGMALAADEIMKGWNSAEAALNRNIRSAATAAASSGKSVARGTQHYAAMAVRSVGSSMAFTGRLVGSGIMSITNILTSGIVFLLHIPGNILEFVSNTPLVSAVIKPADHSEVPIIDPDSPALQAALNTLPPEQTASQTNPPTDTAAAWPVHGLVTTEFGVPHWPYQRTHTGLDISSGQAAGTTPIKPFRPGRVTEAVHSRRGLGNHVLVDHGNGVTSVYAHLTAISVRVGQAVDKSTTLGYEGTTGVSTGTHLHFEIRVNGQAASPRLFISGQP